jgi:hypothetical protein
MNKIGPGMAKIQQKRLPLAFLSVSFPLLYRTSHPHGNFRAQYDTRHLACISAIPGLILVIYPILKIPLAYSISFNWLHFLHGHCGNSYRDFK